MRMPSLLTRSNSNSRRSSGAECVSAACVMVTTEMTWAEICCACGSRWMSEIMPIQAVMLTVVRVPSSRKVRQNRPLFSRARLISGTSFILPRQRSARLSVRDEHVAQAPYGLDEQRARWIWFDQFAQARNLHVQAAVEHFVRSEER